MGSHPWGLGHRGVVPIPTRLTAVLSVVDAPKRVVQQPIGMDSLLPSWFRKGRLWLLDDSAQHLDLACR